MNKTIFPIVIVIIILTVLISVVLYRTVYKLNHPTESARSVPHSQPSDTKEITKLEHPPGEMTALIPSVSNKFSSKSDSKPKPPEIPWSELTQQLLQLEQEREQTAKLLDEKMKSQ